MIYCRLSVCVATGCSTLRMWRNFRTNTNAASRTIANCSGHCCRSNCGARALSKRRDGSKPRSAPNLECGGLTPLLLKLSHARHYKAPSSRRTPNGDQFKNGARTTLEMVPRSGPGGLRSFRWIEQQTVPSDGVQQLSHGSPGLDSISQEITNQLSPAREN